MLRKNIFKIYIFVQTKIGKERVIIGYFNSRCFERVRARVKELKLK